MGMKQKIFFFQNGRLKKTEISKIANSQKCHPHLGARLANGSIICQPGPKVWMTFFAKILCIGPWLVGLIDAKGIDVAQPIWP